MHNQQARRFDGSDQSIDINELLSPIVTAVNEESVSFSISVWCRLSASISSSVTLFKCRHSSSTNNQINLIYHASGNEFRFSTKFGGVNDVAVSGTTNTAGASYEGDGIWHNIVGSVDTENNTTELWIDNVKKDEKVGVGTLDESINAVSLLQNGVNGSYFDGDVKDVALYGRQLTDAEIAVIYNSRGVTGDRCVDLASGARVSKEGLLAYFRFEEKSGTVAINEVGENGAYVNAPVITTNIP